MCDSSLPRVQPTPDLADVLAEMHARFDALEAEVRALQTGNGHDKALLSKAEAAELLGVSLATISNRMRDGSLPYRHVGALVRFRRADVLDGPKRRGR